MKQKYSLLFVIGALVLLFGSLPLVYQYGVKQGAYLQETSNFLIPTDLEEQATLCLEEDRTNCESGLAIGLECQYSVIRYCSFLARAIMENDLSIFADDPRYNSLVEKKQIWDFTKNSFELKTLCDNDETCITTPIPYLKSCEIAHTPVWLEPLPEHTSEDICDNIRHWLGQHSSDSKEEPSMKMRIQTFHGVPISITTHIFEKDKDEPLILRQKIGPSIHTFLIATPEYLFAETIQEIHEATK